MNTFVMDLKQRCLDNGGPTVQNNKKIEALVPLMGLKLLKTYWHLIQQPQC